MLPCARGRYGKLPGESGTLSLYRRRADLRALLSRRAHRHCLAPAWRMLAAACGVVVAACGATASQRSGASTSAATARSHAALPAVCNPMAQSAVARHVGVGPAEVSQRRSTSSQSTPECVYRAGAVEVTAIVDSSPQPYFRLERAVVEATQQFGTVRLEPAPQQITGLGLDADWFPKERQVMTTDGVRLITIAVGWHGVAQARQRRLAEAVARAYLGPLDRKAAEPNGS